MRPIDAYKLIEILDNDVDADVCEAFEIGSIMGYSTHAIKEAIAKTPTLTYADLVPHGRWVEQDERYFSPGGNPIFSCSLCSHKVFDKRIYRWEETPSYNYCPNCGAKMDGGKDNESN